MAKKHYTHKQIRQSIKRDELREMLNRFLQYSKSNTENLLITVIILVLIAILVPLYFQHRADNEKRADNLFNRASAYARQPIADSQNASGNEWFRSLEEKYKKSQQAYAEISSTYRNTQAAKWARLGEANAYVYLKQYDQALAIYQKEMEKNPGSWLKLILLQNIGVCQENLGHWNEALTTYQEILKENPKYYQRQAVRLGIARCFQQLGNASAAKEMLQKIQSEEKTGFWAELARQQFVLMK